MKQAANLICIKAFSFRMSGKPGPRVNVKVGDEFWNTTPEYVIKRDNQAALARKGKNIGYAYPFSMETISEYFEIVG